MLYVTSIDDWLEKRAGQPYFAFLSWQDKDWPVIDKLHQWLQKSLPTTPPKSTLGKALTYLHTQWPRLTGYLNDGVYPYYRFGDQRNERSPHECLRPGHRHPGVACD